MYEPDPDELEDEALEDAPPRPQPPPEAHRRARHEALAQLALALGPFVSARAGPERAGPFDRIASRDPGWGTPAHCSTHALSALLRVWGGL